MASLASKCDPTILVHRISFVELPESTSKELVPKTHMAFYAAMAVETGDSLQIYPSFKNPFQFSIPVSKKIRKIEKKTAERKNDE